MMKLQLSKRQKKLIIKVVDIQLDNLSKIVCDQTPQDMTLFCIENEITMKEVRKMAIKNMIHFDGIKNDPTTLLSLDNDNLQIFRHILQTFVKDSKLIRAKAQVWRKITQFENMVKLYHPN
jgi:hypothetical protein